MKENNTLIWKQKAPSPKHVMNLLMQLSLSDDTARAAAHQTNQKYDCPLEKTIACHVLWSTCPFWLSTTKSLPLLSCLFFLLALVRRELLFYSDPAHSEELLPLFTITEVTWGSDGPASQSSAWVISQSSSSTLDSRVGSPLWDHLVLLSSGKKFLHSTKKHLSLWKSVRKGGPSQSYIQEYLYV